MRKRSAKTAEENAADLRSQGTTRTKLSKRKVYNRYPARKVKMLTIVRDGCALDVEVETGLEDGGATSVTVDADPRRGGVRARAARGLLGRRDGEGARHGLVGSLETTR